MLTTHPCLCTPKLCCSMQFLGTRATHQHSQGRRTPAIISNTDAPTAQQFLPTPEGPVAACMAWGALPCNCRRSMHAEEVPAGATGRETLRLADSRAAPPLASMGAADTRAERIKPYRMQGGCTAHDAGHARSTSRTAGQHPCQQRL